MKYCNVNVKDQRGIKRGRKEKHKCSRDEKVCKDEDADEEKKNVAQRKEGKVKIEGSLDLT